MAITLKAIGIPISNKSSQRPNPKGISTAIVFRQPLKKEKLLKKDMMD